MSNSRCNDGQDTPYKQQAALDPTFQQCANSVYLQDVPASPNHSVSSQNNYVSHDTGAILLCSESLSSTQSGDDSQKLVPAKQSVVWNRVDHPNNRTTVQYALIIGNNHVDIGSHHKFLKNNVLVTPLTTDKENNIIYPSPVLDCLSTDHDECQGKRMNNSDGCDRNRISSCAVTSQEGGSRWSPGGVGAVSQAHNTAAAPPAEGMLSGRSTTGHGHGHQTQSDSPNTMLSAGAVPPVPSVGVFRQSASVEPGQRLLSGGQFISAAGSPLGPYSPLYSVHGQPTHMTSISPYSAFYSQYPHGAAAAAAAAAAYSPGTMLAAAGHYPHIESYSAVLASMGNQVQHGGQSQLPRSPFLSGHLPQFSALGPPPQPQQQHRVSSSAGSPGPTQNIHQTSAHGAGAASSSPAMVGHSPGECLASPKSESRDCDNRSQRGSTSSLREEKSSSLSPSASGVLATKSSTALHDSPKGGHSEQHGNKDSFYKVPSGKEGSLKHRILTRPPDLAPGNGSHVADEFKYQQHAAPLDSPLSKRAKLSQFTEGMAGHPDQAPPVASSSSSSLCRDGRQVGQSGQPRSPGSPPPNLPCPPPHLHYPPHFMKGSIIQLANGELKHVENLQTEDFVNSAEISADLKIDSSTVVRIKEYPERSTAVLGFSVGEHRVQVTVEATSEHPFFVFGQGWSSCSPEWTLRRYGLECHKLSVGDVCISLTHKDVSLCAAEISKQQASEMRASPSVTADRSPKSENPNQGHSVTFSENRDEQNESNKSPGRGSENRESESLDSDSRKRRWMASDCRNNESESDQMPSKSADNGNSVTEN
ncbi:ataxin-1-like [Gigantopelta aegis]|uniref:ataxin-1-like n=1 Tax=Gigantopelta aegis TaxID=1735272 RepID=UPI001B888D99|nr:ataxin-1-like [Gigantopelta aegis]XP_041375227.1 ataxin-1-like [Gigantopelta aegis]